MTFDPSIPGIFIFGLIAGICPCNSVLCLGLIGYLTSGNTRLSPINILKRNVSFCIGTILVLLPLGMNAGLYRQIPPVPQQHNHMGDWEAC